MPPAAARDFKWSFVLDEPARILVADDDPIFREFAKVYLSTPVATIETAADGLEAYDRLRAEAFDLALVDIDMPGLDGFALVERARAQETLRHLPLVVVTGREDIVSIDRAFEAGATSFATKPVNWRQLSYQLRYVLRTSRMEARVRAARDRAEETLAARSGALAAMRHEIRSQLDRVAGLAELLRDGDSPGRPEHQGEALRIAGSCRRLLELMDEMLPDPGAA
jgi:two-component system sensor histidine kinase/response regulator